MNADPDFTKLLSDAQTLRKSIEPSRDLWPAIATGIAEAGSQRSAARSQQPASGFRPLASGLWHPALLAASLAICSAVALWTWREQVARESWPVERLSGSPTVGSMRIASESKVRKGQWIETDANSSARVTVGSIGQVSIDPNSRVRLVSTAASNQRLELARGTLHAIVSAPPRIFFVDTPAATAVDLGCAYTLTVDDTGKGLLHVTIGYVALAHGGVETVVRAGMMCATRPNSAPGTPFAADAPEALRLALDRFDFGSPQALPEVLAAARRLQDARTLWHLLSQVSPSERGVVFDALLRQVPIDPSITREGILAGNKAMIDSWGRLVDAVLGNPMILKKVSTEVLR